MTFYDGRFQQKVTAWPKGDIRKISQNKKPLSFINKTVITTLLNKLLSVVGTHELLPKDERSSRPSSFITVIVKVHSYIRCHW